MCLSFLPKYSIIQANKKRRFNLQKKNLGRRVTGYEVIRKAKQGNEKRLQIILYVG